MHPRKDRVLLVNKEYELRKKKVKINSLPKGKPEEADQGNDFMTLQRELQEETGLIGVQIVQLLGDYVRRSTDRRYWKDIRVFLCKSDQEDLNPIDPKHEAFWVPRHKVIDLLHHKEDKKFFEEKVTAKRLKKLGLL